MEANQVQGVARPPEVVVVGMDFSQLSDRALAFALHWAGRHEASQVHVVSAVMPPNWELPEAPPPATSDQPEFLDGALARLRTHVAERLVAFAEESGSSLSNVEIVSHVRVDSPSVGILNLASELDATLIVVGTHGRRGLARALMGSVAEATVRYARCPVVVVPPCEERPEIKIEPPCPECVRARRASGGKQMWCEQHREHHGRRHTIHERDRAADDGTFPLVFK